MINYRYRKLKKLGEGGSGEVYLVEDTLNQRRQSAMKILFGGDRSDRVAGEQFRNEVSVLATLHHPNLVRVYEFGTIRQCDDPALQGRHFFTMECVIGPTVLEWWRNQRTRHDRLVHLKRIVLQALGVLSYVHRQGIIHFDIKPENLLLLSSGEKDDQFPLLKLTDFGFSAKQKAALDFPLRGTLEYTAPELLRHEAFDYRADLYSLGATVYHLIEDRCPFEAGDPVELIKKVLTTEPEFHRCAEQEYSSMLPLLTNLLQKDPAHRYQSAAEAANVLLENEQPATALAFDWLSKPSFVGREKEKESIGSAVASLRDDPAGNPRVAIVVEGPEGFGKTALLNEMARVARATDVPVFDVSVLQRNLPFSGILSLLPLLRAEGMSRSIEGRELMRRFAEVIDGGSGSEDEHRKDLQVTWLREREKVVEAQARFINQISLLFPFMLIVDDAHLLDPESEEVLRIAARDALPGRLLILAAVRGDGWPAVPGHRIQLEELDARCVSAMSTSALSSMEVSEVLGDRLYQVYGGSPALIVEALLAVNALLPHEVPHQPAEMATLAEHVLRQLPRDIDELLFVRYETLDRGPQLTLDILSCFASPARLEAIQAILPFQTQRTAAYLSLLEAEGLVTSHEDGQRVSMRHARLKSMVYAAIQESRQESHLFIASTMEGFPGVPTFLDLQELAFQYRQAGKDTASISWLEAAADEGMRIAAYRRAKELLIEAVALGEDSTPSALDRLNLKLAHAYFSCGDLREAVELAEKQLRRTAIAVTQQAALHKTAGLAQSRLGRSDEAKLHIMAALQSSVDATESVELQQELVGIDITLGHFAEAERASMAQLGRAKDLDNPRIIAAIYTDLGIATFFQNLLDQSAGHFEEARKIYAASGYHAQLADAMMNIANVMSAKGDIVRAVEYWSNALETSKEYGTLNQQAQIQNNLGIAHSTLKRFPEARDFFDKAKTIFGRLGSNQGNAYVLTNLGEVSFAEGQYEHALLQWQDAQRLYREMDDGQGIVETLLQLAQVRLVLGAIESVGSTLDEAEATANDRSLETFRSHLLYLRGMHMMCLNTYETASLFFTQSEHSSHDGAESERRLLLKVRTAECEHHMGRHDSAVTLAREAKDCAGRISQPQVVAEASFVLGMIATSSPSSVSEKALPFFREGFDSIAQEPVTEITWKLALALGQEFRKRGQRDKAKECFTKARLVLRFFLAQFTSSELKNGYLMMGNKQKIIASLDSYLNM
jgi:serine/threonine protein kinase/tetratricopeptide (TPR) repeat protein